MLSGMKDRMNIRWRLIWGYSRHAVQTRVDALAHRAVRTE